MSGWVVLAVGVVLCFLGVGSVHLASAFGLGWLLVTLVFKAARFVVGLIAGALIGARLYAVFSAGGTSGVLAVVVATALAFGFLADRYKGRVILWATAIGGAGLIMSSLGSIWPDTLVHLAGHPGFRLTRRPSLSS